MAYQWGASDIRAALGLSASNWEVQDSGDSESGSNAVVRNNQGAYIAATDKRYDVKAEKTITLKCKSANAGGATFTLGGPGTDGVVLTQVTVRQVHNDFATITATAHSHEEGAGHIDGANLKQTISISSLGFGVLSNKLGGTLADCQSAEWTFSIEHVEVLDNQGDHSTGASFGFKVEATEEYVADTAPNPSGNWKLDGWDIKTSNTGYNTCSVKAHAYSWS